LNLLAVPSEQWKLRLNDEILFGDDPPVKKGQERSDKFFSVEDKDLLKGSGEDLGDDLTEEAVAGRWTTYIPENPEETQQ
jgi:hypothetical protein